MSLFTAELCLFGVDRYQRQNATCDSVHKKVGQNNGTQVIL